MQADMRRDVHPKPEPFNFNPALTRHTRLARLLCGCLLAVVAVSASGLHFMERDSEGVGLHKFATALRMRDPENDEVWMEKYRKCTTIPKWCVEKADKHLVREVNIRIPYKRMVIQSRGRASLCRAMTKQ